MSERYNEIVTTFPLFRGITPEGAGMLLERGEVRTHEAGDVLFREGDAPSFAMLVLTGRLQVFVQRGGRDVTVSEIGPGALLGELSVLSGIPRSASVRSVEPSTLVVWEDKAFRRLLLGNAFLSERIFGQALRVLIDKERALIDSLLESQAGRAG
jgi:CRP/FNR family transcriptional regulator/CRP/FNR family cyclic AMP-dependent transcriptional regulator